ncbi:MAG: hypothetical protein ACKO96_43805, partial [Flammeovirgaceae bacterium]
SFGSNLGKHMTQIWQAAYWQPQLLNMLLIYHPENKALISLFPQALQHVSKSGPCSTARTDPAVRVRGS